MTIARVFPRRTKATPDDPLAFIGPPPKKGLPDLDEVHVSVAFTYDLAKAYDLAEQWTKTGIPVRLLRSWHVELLRKSRAKRFYFAYDTPEDYAPLVDAGRLLREGGITQASHRASCYVLIGYPNDTMEAAEKRLRDTWNAGLVPFAMLYRDEKGIVNREWGKFQRMWLRPNIVTTKLKANMDIGKVKTG